MLEWTNGLAYFATPLKMKREKFCSGDRESGEKGRESTKRHLKEEAPRHIPTYPSKSKNTLEHVFQSKINIYKNCKSAISYIQAIFLWPIALSTQYML